jgi:hypothetical protein
MSIPGNGRCNAALLSTITSGLCYKDVFTSAKFFAKFFRDVNCAYMLWPPLCYKLMPLFYLTITITLTSIALHWTAH